MRLSEGSVVGERVVVEVALVEDLFHTVGSLVLQADESVHRIQPNLEYSPGSEEDS